jgi:hypothetical protein
MLAEMVLNAPGLRRAVEAEKRLPSSAEHTNPSLDTPGEVIPDARRQDPPPDCGGGAEAVSALGISGRASMVSGILSATGAGNV